MKKFRKFFVGLVLILLGYQASAAASAATSTSLPVAGQPQPNAGPSTGTNPQQKFSAMSIQDQDAVLGEIAKHDFPTIMQNWLNAGRVEHDLGKQDMLWRILAGVIRQRTPPPEFYEQLKAFIEDRSNSNLEREMMIHMLSMAGTKQSLDLLIQVATTLNDKELNDTVNGGISELQSDDESFAPTLSQLWLKTNDIQLAASAALLMAHIGAPSSIELLLSAALAPDGKDDMRKQRGFAALLTVITKNAVPPLSVALANQSPSSSQAALAFATLAQIPDPTAAQALIAWLQTADGSAAPLALNWITNAKHTPQLKAAAAALDQKVPFRSEANREALRIGLAAYQSSHHFISAQQVNQ